MASRPSCALALALLALCAAPSAAVVDMQPEKDRRTPAERKIDAQLLQEIYRARGEALERHVPPAGTDVRLDARGRALVDIRASVGPALTAFIRKIGGEIVSSAPQHRSVIARVPLLKIDRLAARADVIAISPAPEAELRILRTP